MQQKQITYNSANLFYRVTGKGKPVILLHGFGEDGEIWNRQIEFLSAVSEGKDHFQLIVPDLPGSGKSELIEDMSMKGMAEAIKAIIDFEMFQSPLLWAKGICMIGHSMGGYITLAFAQKNPELLHSFGLFSSSAFADSEEKKAARLKSIAFIQNNGAYEFLKTSIPGLFDEHWSKYHQQEIVGLVERAKQFSADAIVKYYQAMIARPDRTEVFTTFSGPVLFIIGEHDKAVPYEQSMQQCYLPAQSHVHILRNSAHMGMWEETDKANAALLQFLQ